jgi:hypothetical protein
MSPGAKESVEGMATGMVTGGMIGAAVGAVSIPFAGPSGRRSLPWSVRISAHWPAACRR